MAERHYGVRMAGRVKVVWSPALLEYDFGTVHPMAPARLDLTIRLVRSLGLLDRPGVEVIGAEPADDLILTTVHEREYVQAVRDASERGLSDLARGIGTEDDPTFPGMHEAAAAVAGGSIRAMEAILRGDVLHEYQPGG